MRLTLAPAAVLLCLLLPMPPTLANPIPAALPMPAKYRVVPIWGDSDEPPPAGDVPQPPPPTATTTTATTATETTTTATTATETTTATTDAAAPAPTATRQPAPYPEPMPKPESKVTTEAGTERATSVIVAAATPGTTMPRIATTTSAETHTPTGFATHHRPFSSSSFPHPTPSSLSPSYSTNSPGNTTAGTLSNSYRYTIATTEIGPTPSDSTTATTSAATTAEYPAETTEYQAPTPTPVAQPPSSSFSPHATSSSMADRWEG